VSKSGYISTPTRAAKSHVGTSAHPASERLYGYFHHRWNVEIINAGFVFRHKTPLLYQHPEYQIGECGQDTLHYFWDGEFAADEAYLGPHEDTLAELKRFALEHRQWMDAAKHGDVDPCRHSHWPATWGPRPSFLSIA
jgi:hypothetical protein